MCNFNVFIIIPVLPLFYIVFPMFLDLIIIRRYISRLNYSNLKNVAFSYHF
nr:MAG TPA: hypothetical protein [Caudoviricetes sp.]